jgi:hypothetical protein
LPLRCRLLAASRALFDVAQATRYPIADSQSEVRCLCAATKRNGLLLNSSPTVKDVKLAVSLHALRFAG